MQELNYKEIGNRIKKQREFLGFTREHLAEQLSKSINFCRDIEIGAKGISIQTLGKISEDLIEGALKNGGRDNITVILLAVKTPE